MLKKKSNEIVQTKRESLKFQSLDSKLKNPKQLIPHSKIQVLAWIMETNGSIQASSPKLFNLP
jgi:hypothetical protein